MNRRAAAISAARAVWPDVEGLGCIRAKVGAAYDETGEPVLVNQSASQVLEGWTGLYQQSPQLARRLLIQAGAQVDLRALRLVFECQD